uniref:Down syndrome cell adhesion molecule-like protein Dscam2 n=1 Tax=Macrostomum lignano TaxID=282301 RepID=A0A1I8GFP9_9PLAT
MMIGILKIIPFLVLNAITFLSLSESTLSLFSKHAANAKYNNGIFISLIKKSLDLSRPARQLQVANFALNATIILKCPLTSNVVWWHSRSRRDNAVPVQSIFSSRLYQLQLPNLLLAIKLKSPDNQTGYYWCQSTTEAISQTKFRSAFLIQLDNKNQLVSVRADRIRLNKLRQAALAVSVSSSVALPCGHVTNSSRIRWLRDGEIVRTGVRLIINSAQLSDSGLYTCWIVDDVDASQLLMVVARWDLTVLPLTDAGASAREAVLESHCSGQLEDGSNSNADKVPCLLTWATGLTATQATSTAMGDRWRHGNQRLRRSLPDGHLNAAPHRLINLRILSETAGRTVRVGWDRPEPATCLRIELRLQPPPSSGPAVTSASCSATLADLPIGRSTNRLSARILGPDGRFSPSASLVIGLGQPNIAPPSGLTAWSRDGVVHVAWQPPQSAADSEIADYIVAYRPAATVEDDDDNNEQRLLTVAGLECQLPPGLPAKRRFLVRVAARTAAGFVGAFTDWLPFDTGHRNAYLSINSGTMADSTNRQSAPTEALAEQLRIKELIPIGKPDSILLSWIRPSHVLPDKYIITYGAHVAKERVAGEIPGNRDTFQIINLKPNTRYFICITALKGNLHFETLVEARTRGSKGLSLFVAVQIFITSTKLFYVYLLMRPPFHISDDP